MWMSSLSVAVALTSASVSAPRPEDVFSVCSHAYDVAKTERRAYSKCIASQTARCFVDFDAALKDAVEAMAGALSANKVALEAYESTQASCSSSLTHARGAVKAWQALETSNAVPFTCDACSKRCGPKSNKNCSCADVASQLGDVSSVRTEAFSSTTAFAGDSKNTVAHLVNYASARTAYDAAFVRNRTQNAHKAVSRAVEILGGAYVAVANASFANLPGDLTNVVACLSLRGGAPCDVKTLGGGRAFRDAKALFADYEQQASIRLALLQRIAGDFAGEAAAYTQRVEKAFLKTAQFYNGVTGWIESLKLKLPKDQWFNLGLDDFYPAGPSWPDGVLFPPLPTASDLYPPSMELLFQQLLLNVSLASLESFAAAKLTIKSMAIQVSSLPALDLAGEYDPPEYADFADGDADLEDVSAAHDAEADAFVQRQAVSLNAFAALKANAQGDAAYSFARWNSTARGAAAQANTIDFGGWEDLSGPSYDVRILLKAAGSVSQGLVLVDYAWRAYHTVATVQRFMKRSALNLPKPDLRQDRAPAGTNYPTLALQIFLSPAGSFALLGASGVVVIYAAFRAYVPLYRQYVAVCVDGGGTRGNGTFLAKNLYSIAYNYAAENGHTAHAKALDDYNSNRGNQCAKYETSSKDQSDDDSLYAQSLQRAMQSSAESIFVMGQCVDHQKLDADFTVRCCGLLGYAPCPAGPPKACPLNEGAAYLPVGAYLADESCRVDASEWSPLRVSAFDCGATPQCRVGCTGPNKQIIRIATQHCACTLEWYFHAELLSALAAFCIYVLMNASRVVFVAAICKLCWRVATPNVFTYLATCGLYGEALPPDALATASAEEAFREALKAELARRLRWWERTARLEVVAALLLNAPWIGLLAVTSNIAYDPNSA